MDQNGSHIGFGKDLNQYIELYYTQEIYDYESKKFTTVEFKAKECDLSDFSNVDTGDHSDTHSDTEDEEKHQKMIKNLYDSWKN